MPIAALAIPFVLIAMVYASVGFGGGSSYTALLLLSGVAVTQVPLISLACNIVVVAVGTARYAAARITPWQRAFPIVACAAPLAFLGGMTPVKEGVLVCVLGAALCVSAVLLSIQPHSARRINLSHPVLFVAAMILAYLAGVTGIGGGIFLAPVLHLARWDAEKPVAATASLFILLNSLFGLGGQIMKSGLDQAIAMAAPYWSLLAAVGVGAIIGSTLSVRIVSVAWIRKFTALLVAVAGIRLLFF